MSETSSFEPEAVAVDTVPTEALPAVFRYEPLKDPYAIMQYVKVYDQASMQNPVGPDIINEVKKGMEPVAFKKYGIDLELLASDARSQKGAAFSRIIRMGGGYEHLRGVLSDKQLEAFAISITGLDSSLYFHGMEQARRMERLMIMQQIAHQRVFGDVHAYFGNTEAAIEGYGSVQLPHFSARDQKYGPLCGYEHDFGEVKMGRDIPFELKTNPAYVKVEAAAAIDLATEVHFPKNDARLVGLLEKRVAAETDPEITLSAEEAAEISCYLHPSEITMAIFGTEKLDQGDVARGEAFAAVERMEYVLSGIRAFEAVEFNYNGVAEDELLRQNLLRLGVSTFFNSLTKLTEYAEKYVAIYDFLAQNKDSINRYMDAVSHDIEARQLDPDDPDGSIFPVDPFANYGRGDTIDANAAKDKFSRTAADWAEWQTKEHLVRSIWENYFGTEHQLTTGNPDVSFLNQTSRRRLKTLVGGGRVAVHKHLADMYGVNLDPEVQAEHETKILQAAGISS